MKDIYNFIPPSVPLPYIGIIDKNDYEFIKTIEEKVKGEFGKKSKQYNTIMGNIDINTGKNMNFFFALYVNQNLPDSMRVASMNDLERVLTLNSKYFINIYCHSTDLILTSKESNFKKNKYLHESLVSQVKKMGYQFSVKNPLILSGIKLSLDNNLKNEYGFLLTTNEKSIIRNNLNFSWEHKPKSNLLEYYCPKDCGIGISLTGVNGNEIYANEGNLSSCEDDERIAIINDVFFEKDLISYLNEIEKNKKSLFSKIKKELSEIDKLKRKLS